MLIINQVTFQKYDQCLSYNFSIPANTLSLISGPSGQGKTTLLSLIAGFLTPNKGQIFFKNQALQTLDPLKRPVSMLFQDHNLFPHLSMVQNIAIGINTSLKLSLQETAQVYEIAKELEIEHLLHKYPSELSGGQRQRAALARILLRKRPLVLLDEPFIGLDHVCLEKCLHAIQRRQKQSELTVVLVSHHYELLEKIVDHVIFV